MQGELPRLDVLYDDVADDTAEAELPASARAAYGGGLALDRPVVYANMVGSIDGIAAERTGERSSRAISAGDPGDRFVMGLLRSHADAIVVGAGTLRAHPDTCWSAGAAFPAAAELYADARARRGSPDRPQLVVLTTSGEMPPHPALPGSIVMTSEDGADRIAHDVAAGADVRVVRSGDRGLDVASALASLRADGYRSILTEGGPMLLGSIADADVLDDLFLTISPLIAGRTGTSSRPGIVDGVAFRPDAFVPMTLLSIRRHGSVLFLCYRSASHHDAPASVGRKGST